MVGIGNIHNRKLFYVILPQGRLDAFLQQIIVRNNVTNIWMVMVNRDSMRKQSSGLYHTI
jgi:hypothetical protein